MRKMMWLAAVAIGCATSGTVPAQKEPQAQQDPQPARQNMAWTQAQDVQGSVISAGEDSLALRTSGSQTLKLYVSDSTPVTLDGRGASVSQLAPGSDVRASWQMVDGQAQALRIRARSTPSPR
jgi:hypothetical protein